MIQIESEMGSSAKMMIPKTTLVLVKLLCTRKVCNAVMVLKEIVLLVDMSMV